MGANFISAYKSPIVEVHHCDGVGRSLNSFRKVLPFQAPTKLVVFSTST